MKPASLTLAVVLFCGCVAAAAKPATVKFRELKNGAFAASSSETPQIVLATNADVYRRGWDVLIASGTPPAVDFAHESVIFLIDRQHNTGGFAVEPQRVDIAATTATVTANVRAPKGGSMTTQVITTPFSVIAVSSPSMTVARWSDASGKMVARTLEKK